MVFINISNVLNDASLYFGIWLITDTRYIGIFKVLMKTYLHALRAGISTCRIC